MLRANFETVETALADRVSVSAPRHSALIVVILSVVMLSVQFLSVAIKPIMLNAIDTKRYS